MDKENVKAARQKMTRLGAIAVTLALASSVHAEEDVKLKPKPLQGHSVTIGVVAGSGYYTEEPDGYHVVITLTKGLERPVRVETVLATGQSMILSSPRDIGSESEIIKITRQGDEVVVTRQP